MTAPQKTDDSKTAEDTDVREHFSRERPKNGQKNGKPGEPYGEETETKDARLNPKTPNGKGLANERYIKSDSESPRVVEEPGSLSGRS
ncbi:hypothetical protein [Asticcacaulis sp. AND118]|uniref:hypothetical protein n=1 Tax=Asticcacaulis sp. AND118 TaxID=2840468 RepID=UPI001D000D80|nr:hypothetical protein [Asticcacaulis sp. AND118]UDF04292.1 hypothetical protein LH365_04445 [Asticcacaulis sp. AND118]